MYILPPDIQLSTTTEHLCFEYLYSDIQLHQLHQSHLQLPPVNMIMIFILFSTLAYALHPVLPSTTPITNYALETSPCYGKGFWSCHKSKEESTAFLTFYIGAFVLLSFLVLAGVCHSWGFFVSSNLDEETPASLNPEKFMEEGYSCENSPTLCFTGEFNAPSCRSSQSDYDTMWKYQHTV